MRYFTLIICLFFIFVNSTADTTVVPRSWKQIINETDTAFFKTEEARRVGEQLLLFQRVTGGWKKNVDMASPLSDEERVKTLAEKERTDDSTTDNGATTMQMKYLARLYQATYDDRYKEAFLKGVKYLLSGQYPNGGWPQFWPNPKGYQVHITYNDDAMANVLFLFLDIIHQKPPYQGDITDMSLRQRLQASVDRGISIILKTQIVTDGHPTVWCQQHDRETLLPAKARAYELPSYCSAESVPLVQLLMMVPNPSDSIKAAVKGAMAWFDKTKLANDSKGRPRWARFYDLEYCLPFFCDRDGVPRRKLEEIGEERRYGYSWYNNRPMLLYPLYEQWLKKVGD